MGDEHPWGESEGEKYEPVDIVDQLTEKIQALPPEKIAEAEVKMKEAIKNKTNPGEILGSVLGVLKGIFLVTVVVLLLVGSCGCFGGRPPEVIQAHQVQQEALLNFAKNQALLHAAEQEAYRAEAYAHIETRFFHDMDQVASHADATGKVDVKEAMAWMKKVLIERDTNRAKVDGKVQAVRVEIEKAQADLKAALKLDALITQWADAGIPLESIQKAADTIMEIYKSRK